MSAVVMPVIKTIVLAASSNTAEFQTLLKKTSTTKMKVVFIGSYSGLDVTKVQYVHSGHSH